VQILQALILFSIAANFLRTFKLRLPALPGTRRAPPRVGEGTPAP
jgi:hypothetical protein